MNNNVELPETKKTIAVKDLKSNHYIFGNKGNVWSNECHIAEQGFSGRTMCGVPMLSNNWARIEKIDVIGCQECIEIYCNQNKLV